MLKINAREISKFRAARQNGVSKMDNEKNCCGKNVIKGITCDVHNCKYHEGFDKCTAGHIKVGPYGAEESRETLCATFENRAQ